METVGTSSGKSSIEFNDGERKTLQDLKRLQRGEGGAARANSAEEEGARTMCWEAPCIIHALVQGAGGTTSRGGGLEE